ncbi:MAG: branched-chain amino acid ABC transporter substrate-binding protein [Rhodobacteraceae bacterium]|nr:MAG: branched-chain amino acid ABC transporter substrate-binding protein [Paracoccaceae bacterium]
MLRTVLTAAIALAPMAASAAEVVSAVLRIERERPAPISRLELPAGDEGFMGALLATRDNETTGGFLGHTYVLHKAAALPEDATAALDDLIEQGARFIVTLAEADDLLALADHAAGRDVLLLNVSAPDDRLRGVDCRANVLHATPSRRMLADGLAQYLLWKRWDRWALVHGSHPRDREKAEALRAAARRFGARIVSELAFEDTGGARRSDTGHVLVQRQIPGLMQGLREHDVVVVADESQVFGVHMPYRGWTARPVAGDAGLRATAWHPAHEGFGATQLQRRFEALAGRRMTDLDYEAWVALRAVSEAVTRTDTADLATVLAHLLSDDFELAAFKGMPLSFRPWSRQLRQAVILGDGFTVVSISPQEEFLHQRTRLDTLGVDEAESACPL